MVITGASRGIGKGIALAFAAEGANVVITYRTDEQLADEVVQACRKLDVKANKMKANLIDEEDRNSLVNKCYESGDVDILVNNAGMGTRASFLKLSEKEVREVLEVNLMAPFFLMQDFSNRMEAKQEERKRSKEHLKDYSIINITSISQTVVYPGLSHYEASKAALNQLTKSASAELAKYQIRINAVAPGIIPTDINRNVRENNKEIWQKRIQSIPLNRPGTTEEIANSVLFLARNSWITGTSLVIDGGYSNNWQGPEATIFVAKTDCVI